MTFTLKISDVNLNRIMAALGEQKLRDVVDLWADLKQQAEAQLPKPVAVEEKAAS